jgi:hypothetical protein
MALPSMRIVVPIVRTAIDALLSTLAILSRILRENRLKAAPTFDKY